MPIYEYKCNKCGHNFELMRKLSEIEQPAPCPQCGRLGERLVSVFATKVGFYLKTPEKPAFRKPS